MTKKRSPLSKGSELVTKNHLENYMDKRFSEERMYIDRKINSVLKYIDFKIEPLENLKNRFDDLESKMYDRLDWIMGTLKRMEEEMIISNKRFHDLNNQVDNHENRLTALEHAAG